MKSRFFFLLALFAAQEQVLNRFGDNPLVSGRDKDMTEQEQLRLRAESMIDVRDVGKIKASWDLSTEQERQDAGPGRGTRDNGKGCPSLS